MEMLTRGRWPQSLGTDVLLALDPFCLGDYEISQVNAKCNILFEICLYLTVLRFIVDHI